MPYYYNPTTDIPLMTENDLRDPNMVNFINEGYELVMQALEKGEINVTGIPNKELCLYLYPYDPSVVYYYFIDHDSQFIFWLDEKATSEELGLHRFLDEEHLSECFIYYLYSGTEIDDHF